tara:strand:- start:89 stop:517 length:429 start_codon:yes stop_codon:yes gene_type:complete
MTNYALICDIANLLGLIGIILISKNKLHHIDKYMIYYLFSGLFLYFQSRINDIPTLTEVYHYMQAIAFILIPFISHSKELLNWHLFFMIFTLASRKKINGCIVRKLESDNPLTQNSFTEKFDWDMIFPLLAVSSLANLYIYH